MQIVVHEINHMKFIVLLCLLVSLSCAAADGQGHYQVLGRGTISCGSLVEAREQKDRLSILLVSDWVNGYLTALNNTTDGVNDLTEGLDLAARDEWLLKYCKDNPLDNLAAAAEKLSHELKSRR